MTGDAGVVSASNARLVIAAGKHYLFAIKENFNKLLPLARGLLAHAPVLAETRERAQGMTVWRTLRRVVVPNGVTFPGATQFICVTQTKMDDCGHTIEEERIFLTSIPVGELSDARLLKLVRLHWRIENGANWTADLILKEDTQHPCAVNNAIIVVSWLRMLAFNLLTLARVSASGAGRTLVRWRRAQDLLYAALLGPVPQEQPTLDLV